MNPTTVHSSEVVGQLVLIEADPIRQRVRHAIGDRWYSHDLRPDSPAARWHVVIEVGRIAELALETN